MLNCFKGGRYFQSEQPAANEDTELKRELERYGIGSLYSKLLEAGVKASILWKLDDEMVKLCSFDGIEMALYITAKERNSATEEKSNSTKVSGIFCISYLTVFAKLN